MFSLFNLQGTPLCFEVSFAGQLWHSITVWSLCQVLFSSFLSFFRPWLPLSRRTLGYYIPLSPICQQVFSYFFNLLFPRFFDLIHWSYQSALCSFLIQSFWGSLQIFLVRRFSCKKNLCISNLFAIIMTVRATYIFYEWST